MEPPETDELSERELNELLAAWQAPPAPAHLRAAIFGETAGPWWRRLWRASIRVPVPVVVCLAILLALVVWRSAKSNVPPRTKQVEPASELQPVAELRPKIIRRGNAQK